MLIQWGFSFALLSSPSGGQKSFLLLIHEYSCHNIPYIATSKVAGSVKNWSSNILLQENATFGKYANISQDSEERGLLEDHSYNFPHHKSFSVNFQSVFQFFCFVLGLSLTSHRAFHMVSTHLYSKTVVTVNV